MAQIIKQNKKFLGGFLIFEGVLILIPLYILGTAIGWPASLSAPAGEVLPLILEKSTAVTAGYFIYLVYSILFFPMALLFSRYVHGGDFLGNSGLISIGFAALSTLARCFGIIRWLTAMPILGRYWIDIPGRDIEAIYYAFNSLAGGLGEIVGVGIFAGIWMIITSITLLRKKNMHPFWGWSGIFSGVLVMGPFVELFGIKMGGLISITTSVLHFWWVGAGITLIANRRH